MASEKMRAFSFATISQRLSTLNAQTVDRENQEEGRRWR
jgi:hypothetical protein